MIILDQWKTAIFLLCHLCPPGSLYHALARLPCSFLIPVTPYDTYVLFLDILDNPE
jgi:hypothetical protein